VTARTLRVADGSRTYRRGDEAVPALQAVDIAFMGGEFVALTGPSGSGKSTLLLVLAGWETLDSGVVEFSDSGHSQAPGGLQWRDLAVVPQALGLIDDLTVDANVNLPARLGRRQAGRDYVGALFEFLDIEKLRHARANELSLGEQQRVAVARALVLQPAVVLADEPSTHQDADHGRAVFEALRRAADGGAVVVVASHDPDGLSYADRILMMADGRLAEPDRPGG
jgi:ABC-type lipoprotein export system ATPase subunit